MLTAPEKFQPRKLKEYRDLLMGKIQSLDWSWGAQDDSEIAHMLRRINDIYKY